MSETNSTAITTFIIPTIGRNSISDSLDSLQQQTNPKWKAIIVYDNKPIASLDKKYIDDGRIQQVRYEGRAGAGLTRNFGISLVDTKWISFVDDDDTVYEKYVDFLQQHDNEYQRLDAVLFRMRHYKKHLDPLPPPTCNSIVKFQMGISFSVTAQMLREYKLKFPVGICEDFTLMHHIFQKYRTILISGHVAYFVRNAKKEYAQYQDVIVTRK